MLKLDPKNTELLAQRQSVLKENIAQTTEKLKQLKTAQDLYIKSGGDLNSSEYRNLQREIISTENKLKQLNLEASKFKQIGDTLDKVGKKVNEFGKSITKIGKTLTTSLTIPIVSLGTLATKTAVDFESAFTGVEKTVDGTAEQLEELKVGIKSMAKEIPSSTTEIAAVAEAAGQLGIKTEDILSFTKVMIDLGNSTNLSANEASSALAKFANVTKMSAKNYDRLGSTIVDLGNNFATTEKDIVEMATRLAATGELAGLSQPQILSLATAMSSVGIEAEAGGSAMSKLLKKIQVATELGGKNLNNFAKVAGVTSKEFKKAYQEDAIKALSMFIDGLNDTERNGKSAIAILDDMKLSEVRLSNTILSLANANDLMSNSIELGNKAWNDNTALTNEANKRYATLQSKISTLKNKLLDIGITLGEIIMPYAEKIVNKVGEIAEKLNSVNPKTQELIVKIAAVVALIGPALLIIGKLISSLGIIIGIVGKISSLIAGLITGTSALSGVLAALTGPVGIVIGAIAILAAEFALLWNKSETFRNSMTEVGKSLVNTYNDHIKPTIENIKQILSMLWNDIIVPLAQYLWGTFGPIIEKVFTIAGKVIADVFDKVGIIIQGITGVLKGLIQFISGVFTGDWKKAWEGVKQIFGSVFEGLKSLFKAPINWIIDKLNSFIKGISKIQIPDWVPGVGGKGINIPLVPKLAKGGIVDSATLAMIGEGKSAEAVIPLDRTLTKYMAEALKLAGGNRSITVNFYPQKMTDAEMDRAFDYIDKRFGMEY